MNFADYLKLLNWTGRQRVGSLEKPKIPKDFEPILKRIGIDGQMWCDLVWNFKKYSDRESTAGSPKSLKDSAAKRNRKFALGQNAVASCFVGLWSEKLPLLKCLLGTHPTMCTVPQSK